jgi:hypothetical protein
MGKTSEGAIVHVECPLEENCRLYGHIVRPQSRQVFLKQAAFARGFSLHGGTGPNQTFNFCFTD